METESVILYYPQLYKISVLFDSAEPPKAVGGD